jgi:hypothetical protein
VKTPRETLERNLARARRRLNNTSTVVTGRQFAVTVEGTVITFECKRARHQYRIDFGSKRRRLTARLSPDGCKFHASWWSEEKGGCIGACPKCEKER